MAHHYQEVGMSLSYLDLTQVILNVDEGIRATSYLISKLQEAIISPTL